MFLQHILRKLNKKLLKLTWLQQRFVISKVIIEKGLYILVIYDRFRSEEIMVRTKTASITAFRDQIMYAAGFQKHKDVIDELSK